METADTRKEDMGKEPDRNDRDKVRQAEKDHDEVTALGTEAGEGNANDIVPALQEEHPGGPGAGYEEFVQEDANLRADSNDVERESIPDEQSNVERESYSRSDDTEREEL